MGSTIGDMTQREMMTMTTATDTMTGPNRVWRDANRHREGVAETLAAAYRLATDADDMGDREDAEGLAMREADARELDLDVDDLTDGSALQDAVMDWLHEYGLGITEHGSRSLGDMWETDRIDVLLATGGPAYGIEYDGSTARFWYQDWSTQRVYPFGGDQDALDWFCAYWWSYAQQCA